MNMNWSLIFDISQWVIILVMTPLLMRRRPQSEAMAWMLLVILWPWVGLGVYLLIGSNRLPRRRIARHLKTARALDAADRLRDRQPHIVSPTVPPASHGLIQLAQTLGELPILGGNDMTLLTDTRVYIDRLLADIAAARHHVHLLYYIFEADETGQRVADALIEAAGRGVKVRLLADAVGSGPFLRRIAPELERHGIEVHDILPVNPFRRRLARLDLRNHRKLAIIDAAIAYTGSQNITNPHYGSHNWPWREISARITGPTVTQLQAIFLEDFYAEADRILTDPDIHPDPPATGSIALQALPSGPTYPTESYQRLVVAAIHGASHQVTITTPYLVPDEPFLQAMESAVMRGVEVSIIVPRNSDQLLTAAAGRAYYQQMLDIGIKIYDYLDGILHAKTMTVDDHLALIGSGNFDIRSFYLNFELNLLAYGPAPTSHLLAAQRSYMQHAIELTADGWRQRPPIRRTLDDIAKLFSPVL
jgi:cardiolipin synthase